MAEPLTAYQQGRLARCTGADYLRDNPYAPTTMPWSNWRQGWTFEDAALGSAPAASPKPKVVQIAVAQEDERSHGGIYALCDDGTLWFRSGGGWLRVSTPGEDG